MSNNKEALTKWVASEWHWAAEVTGLFYIDYRAAKDLARYHPEVDKGYLMKHVPAQDADGKWYVKVELESDNWDEKFRTVEESLKLYLETDRHGNDFLVDYNIDGSNPAMSGWVVTEWKVVKNYNAKGEILHQDIITWAMDGEKVQSIYSWRPYAPIALAPSSGSVELTKQAERV